MKTTHTSLAWTTILSALLTASAMADDWPTWRGPGGDGVSSESDWVVEGRPESVWTKKVGLGYSTFVISNGRVVTLGHDAEAERDVVYCLDAASGEERWTYSYPSKKWAEFHGGGTLSTPTIDGDRVYVLTREGKLFCLSLSDGKVQWQKNLMDEYELKYPQWMFSSSPVINGEKVYINVGPLLALNKANGEEIWKTRNTGDAYSTPLLMQAGGRDHLVIFNGEGVVLFDPTDGTEGPSYEWKTSYNVNAATPVVVGDRIFISSGYNRGCAMLELVEGDVKPLWEGKQMRNQTNGCVLWEGHLYGFDDQILKCIDADGNEKWAQRGLGQGSLMIADGKLIVLSSKGELIIANATPEAFTELSRTKVLDGGQYWSAPILANGFIYCRNSVGDVACRDHRSSAG